LGTSHLASGHFQEGWKGYYNRAGRTKFSKQYPGITVAEYLPSSLTGSRILLLNEQGLGDQLFLLRWVNAIKSRGASVFYRPDAKLESIIRRTNLVDRLIPAADPLPQENLNVMLGDLPYLVSYGADGMPVPCSPVDLVPPSLKLQSLPENRAAIKNRLQQLGPPPYIGVTWRGGTPPEEQTAVMSWMLYKEIPLAALANAMRDVTGTLIALQRKPGAGEIDRLSELMQRPLHDFSSANEQLEDMLALLALLDDYVGVSNTNMHLRVAVGKTARVLVPCPPEWRWMASGNESPWFPGFPIYRQGINGEWTDALSKLSNDLKIGHP
jgi:hypothetical protein